MADNDSARETFDSLNPYEVAVLAMTSAPVIEEEREVLPGAVPKTRHHRRRDEVVLTGKQAYLWAGAVAHVLVRNPSLEREAVLGYLERAFSDAGPRMRDVLAGVSLGEAPYLETGVVLVEAFLAAAGLSGELDEVRARTADAIKSLEWQGLIEDPFKKRIGKILLSVALIMPIGFTSTTTKGEEVHGLTWVYKSEPQGNETKRDFHLKVHEITEVLLDDVIPHAIHVVAKLAHPEEKMSTTEVQRRLKDLGYYHASVDGKEGPKTAEAIKHFQMDRSLRITGYPDETTKSALRKAKKW
jgi:hypothetical protein